MSFILKERASGKSTYLYQRIIDRLGLSANHYFYTATKTMARLHCQRFVEYLNKNEISHTYIHSLDVIRMGHKKIYFRALELSIGECYLDEGSLMFDTITATPNRLPEISVNVLHPEFYNQK